MEDKLCKDLASLNLPIYQQNSIGEGEVYPSTFITYWNIDTPDTDFYDNKPNTAEWLYGFYVYSNDPIKLKEQFNKAIELLLAAGWIVKNRKGYSIPSDVDTHTGKTTRIIFEEKYNV